MIIHPATRLPLAGSSMASAQGFATWDVDKLLLGAPLDSRQRDRSRSRQTLPDSIAPDL